MLSRSDLEMIYVTGVDFEVPNPADENSPFKLHYRKMNPSQQAKAAKKANAARVRMSKIVERDDDDDEKLLMLEEVDSLGGRDGWIVFLTESEIMSDRQKVEQELSEEEEWAKDDYLQSLVDSWDVDAQLAYAKGRDQCDPTIVKCYDEMKRFVNLVDAALEDKRKGAARKFSSMSDEELEREILKLFVEQMAGLEFMRVLRDCQIMYGILERETKTQLYKTLEEVESIPIELYQQFVNVIGEQSIPSTELKS